jgi:hypothetical protein
MLPVNCANCRHYGSNGLATCAVFPAGIPLPILSGDFLHDRPFPGDKGRLFEPWPLTKRTEETGGQDNA